MTANKMEARYEGHFLDALDLPEGKLVAVEIAAIAEPLTEKDAAGKAIKSAILSFKGKDKRLILNVTNWKNLKAMFGKDWAQWIGKTIQLQRRYLDAARGFGVQNTLAIRIIPPVGTPILRSAANYMGSVTPYGDVPKQQEPKRDVAAELREAIDTALAGDAEAGWQTLDGIAERAKKAGLDTATLRALGMETLKAKLDLVIVTTPKLKTPEELDAWDGRLGKVMDTVQEHELTDFDAACKTALQGLGDRREAVSIPT